MYQSTTMIWPSGLRLGHEQEDHVVEHVLHARRRVGGQAVDQFERHLRRADLGRVHAARHDDDGLARLEDLVALRVGRRAVLEVEPALQAAVVVRPLQRLRRTRFRARRTGCPRSTCPARARARGPTPSRPAGSSRASCPTAPASCRRRRGSRGTARASARGACCAPAVAVDSGPEERRQRPRTKASTNRVARMSVSLSCPAGSQGAAVPGTIADFGAAGEARYRTEHDRGTSPGPRAPWH